MYKHLCFYLHTQIYTHRIICTEYILILHRLSALFARYLYPIHNLIQFRSYIADATYHWSWKDTLKPADLGKLIQRPLRILPLKMMLSTWQSIYQQSGRIFALPILDSCAIFFIHRILWKTWFYQTFMILCSLVTVLLHQGHCPREAWTSGSYLKKKWSHQGSSWMKSFYVLSL